MRVSRKWLIGFRLKLGLSRRTSIALYCPFAGRITIGSILLSQAVRNGSDRFLGLCLKHIDCLCFYFRSFDVLVLFSDI